MIKKLLLYPTILILTLSLVYAIPGSWYGYATLDSSTAADNVIIDARIDGSIVATTTVGAVQSNGYYLLHRWRCSRFACLYFDRHSAFSILYQGQSGVEVSNNGMNADCGTRRFASRTTAGYSGR